MFLTRCGKLGNLNIALKKRTKKKKAARKQFSLPARVRTRVVSFIVV